MSPGSYCLISIVSTALSLYLYNDFMFIKCHLWGMTAGLYWYSKLRYDMYRDKMRTIRYERYNTVRCLACTCCSLFLLESQWCINPGVVAPTVPWQVNCIHVNNHSVWIGSFTWIARLTIFPCAFCTKEVRDHHLAIAFVGCYRILESSPQLHSRPTATMESSPQLWNSLPSPARSPPKQRPH